ncbi:gamma-glutamyltransferase family protein [Candidatus Nephthysia bennettiae]|uniref:Gamma-glutamyltransferase family protein n=1 Tax=Candidatus Nephthysia bennettiae TaxID=3127016 RepID=A0A934ND66_9BACT|nr:gamma-glutamyltransferase family protein [Candidatus Dormibacteraeota bacterium]MBJ7611322.1 gamma-glutamyltransferase family protein [Candidatus Dormibacteraeota bacterium]
MVASTHWLASQAGMAVLERGGNAFDAAVAAGFTLQVVEPHLNGPGGEMPAVVYSAERREVLVVCGQGPAPAAATIERFRERGLDMVPPTGLLAACVPGAVGGWLLMLRELGTWPLSEVLGFAIGYADKGFPLVPRISEAIAGVEQDFREAWQESAEIWLSGGGVPAPGSLFRNPLLAATYRRLLDAAGASGGGREEQIEAARKVWYEGFVAEAIDRHLSSAPESEGGPGLLAGADLAGWRASLEPPLAHGYGPWRVFKTRPWGQGPVFLQQLALLSGFDVGRMPAGGADFIHTVIECAKLAFADREAWYGDPDFAPDRTPELLSAGYNEGRRRLVAETASFELRPGSPAGLAPRLPRPRNASGLEEGAGVGDPTTAAYRRRPGDTCHVDVVDRWGNLVSATPSGGWLQSSPAIPGLGFCLGTRAQIFTLERGLPNSLEPRKRPRTTLSPTLAEREDGLRLAFGTPGADQQDQWALNFFVRLASEGGNLQEAIDAPNWHTQHFPRSFFPHHALPGSLAVENRVGEATIAELRRRGHAVEVLPGWSAGRLSAVADDRPRGLLRAAANPRGMQGYAVGR